MNKILMNVHSNFDDIEAVEHIAEFTSKTRSAIEVLHVIEDFPQDLQEWWNVRYPVKLYEEIVNKRQEFVDSIVERIERAGVSNVTSKLRWGSELHEVTREVIENKHELVVTTSRPVGTLLRKANGCSCLKGLCRHCPSLIWVMRSPLRLPTRRLLVALKGENGMVFADDFNAKMLRAATWIAEASGSQLHIVHVLSDPELWTVLAQRFGVDQGGLLDKLRSEIRQTCNRLLGTSGQSVTVDRIHLLLGSPRVVIPKFVQQMPMDLMLIGTKARSGLRGMLKGNLAERIIEQVDCSVLTIKPDDFVSPLLSNNGVYTMPHLKAA